METIGYCKDCLQRDNNGYCDSKKIREGPRCKEDEEDELIYSYSESGSFWVGEKFGCIHFENGVHWSMKL